MTKYGRLPIEDYEKIHGEVKSMGAEAVIYEECAKSRLSAGAIVYGEAEGAARVEGEAGDQTAGGEIKQELNRTRNSKS